MLAKEHGSSIEYGPDGDAIQLWRERPNAAGVRLFGTARQALIALVRTLHRRSNLRRTLLPDHYWHVTTLALATAVANTGVAVELYPATFGKSGLRRSRAISS